MPIGAFERELMRLLAANRHPDSFVGGATVLLRGTDSPRESEDIDVFHDTTESLRRAVDVDMKTLTDAGFQCELTVSSVNFFRASAQRGGHLTKLEWVFDSAYRFFPVEPDEDMGWRLNFWDAATNKVLAFAGRSVIRDYLDVLYLHQQHLAFGALVWAAAAKDPGLTPEMIVEGANRNSRFPGEDLSKLRLSQPVDLVLLKQVFIRAADEAMSLFGKLPPAEMGCLYLDARGQPVCPDPDSPEFARLTRHFGSIKGAWPRLAE